MAGLALGAIIAWALFREQQFHREREQWINERASLLNRIKPETAQVTGIKDVENYLVEPVRDDEDYWAARGMDWKPEDQVQFTPYGVPVQGDNPYAEPPEAA